MDQEMIENFIKDYKNGLSTIKIGTKYGFSCTTIYNYLKKSNVAIRPANERNRKYQLNEHYFDEINTPEKAYFLGILYADGNNCQNKIRLVLTDSDKSLLEKLSNLIYIEHRPLIIQKGRTNSVNGKPHQTKNSYVLSISNKNIQINLEKYGVIKNKTNKITFPFFLPQDLLSHFLRGYIDGDGSVCFKKDGQSSVSFVGTEQFCQSTKNLIKSILDIDSTVCHAKKDSKMKQFILHGNIVCKKFLDWLYSNQTICLQRKYNKYLEILEKIPKRFESCIVCGEPHFGQGYCKKHHYEFVGKQKRRERYLNTGK